MKKIIFKNLLVKNILLIILVPIIGFVLLNLTFVLNAIFQGFLRRFLMIFINFDKEMNLGWLPPMMRILFVVFILAVSFFILTSKKIKPTLKSIFLVVPTATVLVTMGIFLYESPIISYLSGFLFVSGVLFYFYKTKKPWFYYYSVILISLVLAIFTALGGEI